MSTYEFDSDDDETYLLVAESGSIDQNGYGMFVDSTGRSFHGDYRSAQRYYTEYDAERAMREAQSRYGTDCDLISITH